MPPCKQGGISSCLTVILQKNFECLIVYSDNVKSAFKSYVFIFSRDTFCGNEFAIYGIDIYHCIFRIEDFHSVIRCPDCDRGSGLFDVLSR